MELKNKNGLAGMFPDLFYMGALLDDGGDSITEPTPDDPPNGILLRDADDLSTANWLKTNSTITTLADFAFRLTPTLAPSNAILAQDVLDAAPLGKTYRAGCWFRLRTAAATDVRLTLMEYLDATWLAESYADVDAVAAIGDGNWVLVTHDRVMNQATANKIRWAVQIVGPTDNTGTIEVTRPYLYEII